MAFDIGRRQFVSALAGVAATWPLAARASVMRRIGVLSGTSVDDAQGQADVAAFLQELQQLGWTEGRNVHIETRWAGGNLANLRKYAAELIALAVKDCITARSPSAGMDGQFGRSSPRLGRSIARLNPWPARSLGSGTSLLLWLCDFATSAPFLAPLMATSAPLLAPLMATNSPLVTALHAQRPAGRRWGSSRRRGRSLGLSIGPR